MKPRRTVSGRGEYLGGSRFRWIWPCGHTRTETVTVGPKGPGSRVHRRPMAPEMCAKMASYWAQRISLPPCPTCGK
jgi:hypothetical protein